ncbi:MAG: hypothetical protein ACK4VV_15895 [Pseudomonas sp.]
MKKYLYAAVASGLLLASGMTLAEETNQQAAAPGTSGSTNSQGGVGGLSKGGIVVGLAIAGGAIAAASGGGGGGSGTTGTTGTTN